MRITPNFDISLPRIFGLLVAVLTTLWLIIARPVVVFDSNSAFDTEHSALEALRLKETVRAISQDFFPRNSQHPEVLSKLADYLFKEFQESAKEVTFQEFVVDGESFKNVIARFGPDTTNTIVIGAHYDSYGKLPGADDNASGVAGLLALSQLLRNTPLDRQVLLVAYSLEEPPHFGTQNMGSFVHAESLYRAGKTIDLMISLEMIGFFNSAQNSQQYPLPLLQLFYPQRGDFIAVVDQMGSGKSVAIKSAINANTNLEAYSINAPNFVTGVDFSDHRNFWQFDYPAVMVTNTAFYRNHHYHTKMDTYDTLDYEKMAEVIYGVYCYLRDAS